MSNSHDDEYYMEQMEQKLKDLKKENKILKKLLGEFVEMNGEECDHLDHHGNCQTHFLESAEECLIARTLEVL